jgi:hypothetical protein
MESSFFVSWYQRITFKIAIPLLNWSICDHLDLTPFATIQDVVALKEDRSQ